MYNEYNIFTNTTNQYIFNSDSCEHMAEKQKKEQIRF